MAVRLPFMASYFSMLLQVFNPNGALPFLGVNYGLVADNLPPPAAAAKLLQGTTISKVRLYNADPNVIRALANTGIGIFIGVGSGEIPSLSNDPNAAKQWIGANVVPYLPASNIILISVGNEVFTSGDLGLAAQLLPAMQNLHSALVSSSLDGRIKITTVHSMAVLGQSEPPSAGQFQSSLTDQMKGILGFLQQTGAPFAINPYPYFAYASDSRPETLAFCLFQQNQGRFDAGTKITYMNMFDAQLDAVHSALSAAGYKGVDIVVAETGWPYKGGNSEVGPSSDNAKAYNGGLVAHLRSLAGTPLMPGRSVDTYLFALFDEDLKPGAMSEKFFGLYTPNGLSMNYDIGLTRNSNNTQVAPPNNPSPGKPQPGSSVWCVPKQGVDEATLQTNLDYACGQAGMDCRPIQPGGACFTPDTIASHAAFAMNLLYQTAGRNPWNCDFTQTAVLTTNNPSYGSCIYPAAGS